MGLGEATDQRCHQMPPGRPAPDHRQSPTACPAGRRPSRLVRTPACLRRAGSPSRAHAPTCSAHTRPRPPRATAPVPTAHSSMPRVWQHLLRVPGLGNPAPHPTLRLSLVRREFWHRAPGGGLGSCLHPAVLGPHPACSGPSRASQQPQEMVPLTAPSLQMEPRPAHVPTPSVPPAPGWCRNPAPAAVGSEL